MRLRFALAACILVAAVMLVRAASGVSTIITTVAATNTPGQLTATSTKASKVVFYGLKSELVTNASTVWIQWASANTNVGVKLAAGGSYTFEPSSVHSKELSNIWIDVETAADGVVAVVFE